MLGCVVSRAGMLTLDPAALTVTLEPRRNFELRSTPPANTLALRDSLGEDSGECSLELVLPRLPGVLIGGPISEGHNVTLAPLGASGLNPRCPAMLSSLEGLRALASTTVITMTPPSLLFITQLLCAGELFQ